MGTRKGRTNKLKNTGQMQCVFEKAILGGEFSPRYSFIAFPLNHRNRTEASYSFYHRDNKLSILGDNTNTHITNTIQAFKHRHCSISATTYAYSSSHKVEWYPHTHDHSTLFSSITILQIMDTAREQYVSRAGHYTIRPPAGTCRGNPP
jgi:hypothetical protein